MRTTVGIFDSGVGGLTVAEALHRLLPALPLRYVADTACFPYGDRTEAVVRERALTLAERLVDEGLLAAGRRLPTLPPPRPWSGCARPSACRWWVWSRR